MIFNTISNGHINKSTNEQEKFVIEGIMSKPIVDFENEVIGTESYIDAINTIKERNSSGRPIPMFVEHRRKELSLPVGKIIDAWTDDEALYFRGEIAGGSLGEPIRELIKGGYLYGCSIGGDALKSTRYFDSNLNRDVKKITKMDLRELSLTGLPVNQEAVFAMAKSLNKDESEVKMLMSKLDKAIDAQKQISKLEKAVDTENLNEQDLNRIKEALNNLSQLLGIDVSENQEVNASEENVTENTQLPPKEEETVQKEEPRKMVDANSENDISNDEDILEQDEDEEALVNTNSNTLEEINSKLDELLSKKPNSIKKNEDELEDEDEEEMEELDEEDEEDDELNEEFIEQNNKKRKSLGGEYMEVLKCRGCQEEFDTTMEKSYGAKFCPICGDRLEKSIERNTDIVCEDCGSVFENAEEYAMHYCPKCGKSLKDSSAMAIAPKAKGADTQYEDKKEMPEGTEDAGSAAMAEAPAAKGADTKVTASEKKETGSSVAEYGDGVYVEPNKKERTDNKDEDINEARPSGKPLLSSFDANKVKTYGTDRTEKSLEEKVNSLEKAIDSLTTEKSKGRKSLVIETEEKKSVEKSQASQEDIDRAFARMIFKK